jgi:hypothetical protein
MKRILLILLLSLVLTSVSVADSPNMMGLRLGTYTDLEEPYIGIEYLTGIAPNIDINPNLEYVLTDMGTFYTLNFDFHYDAYTVRRGPFAWVGAGLAYTSFDPDGPIEGDSDLGLNLFFGAGLDRPGFVPYVQLKFLIGDYDDTVLNAGLRFLL